MRRRSLLAALGVMFAGCTSNSAPGSPSDTTSSPTQTASEANPSQQTATDPQTAYDKYPQSVTEGTIRVETGGYIKADSLHYYDGSLKTLEPDHGEWAWAMTTVHNLGGESISTPSTDSFSLLVDGTEYQPLSELPVDTDSLRDPTAHWKTADTKPEISPGGSSHPNFVFDTRPTEYPILKYEGESTHKLSYHPRMVSEA